MTTWDTSKFHRGQQVVHVKTRKIYFITGMPHPSFLLEHCNEPFYTYRSFEETNDETIWHRCKSEMEDGRFVGANHCRGCGEPMNNTVFTVCDDCWEKMNEGVP
jgi:hypothetical protein